MFNLYLALEVQTIDMITSSQETLNMLSVLLNICILTKILISWTWALIYSQNYIQKIKNREKDLKNWEFPKNHIQADVFDDIIAKGATCVYNMKPNDKMHGSLKESYQWWTNFKNITEQVQVISLRFQIQLTNVFYADTDSSCWSWPTSIIVYMVQDQRV